MPWECTSIIVREEVHSNGGCTLYICILGATPVDNPLASEEVDWTFFLRVGDCTGLLGVTIESISTSEISTRYWKGEQEAVAAAARRGTQHYT